MYIEETDVYLTNGTGGSLKVYDNSPRLEQGVLIITRIIDENVSNIQVRGAIVPLPFPSTHTSARMQHAHRSI